MVTLFLIVLAIAWIVLPFALIGTKPLLRELLAESRRTNEILHNIEKRAEAYFPVQPATSVATQANTARTLPDAPMFADR